MPKDEKGIWGTLGDEFFSFFPKNINGEVIWGTLGYQSMLPFGLEANPCMGRDETECV
jgi:hypothetical protein